MKKPNSKLERLYLLLVEDILEGDISIARKVISDAGYDPDVTRVEGERKIKEVTESHEQEQPAPDYFFLGTDFTINPGGGLFYSFALSKSHTPNICMGSNQVAKDDSGDINDAYAQSVEPECHFSDTLHLHKLCN